MRADPQARTAGATVAPANVPSNQSTILGRVFAPSVAEFLGVRIANVGVGSATYPVLVSGSGASQQIKGAEVPVTSASYSSEKLDPLRLTGKLILRVEDLAVFPNLENSLRQDIRLELSNQMSKQIVTGSGVAPNVSGFLTTLADPTDPSAIAVGSDYVAAVTDSIDGLYASQMSEVRALVRPEQYRHMAATFLKDTDSDFSVLLWLNNQSGGIRASAHLPAATNANVTKSIVFGFGQGNMGNSVAAIWSGFRLLKDENTLASSGEIALTALALWNFAVVREGAYAQKEAKVA